MFTSTPNHNASPANKKALVASLFLIPAISIPLLAKQPKEVMVSFYSFYVVVLCISVAVILRNRISRPVAYTLVGTAVCAMAIFVTSAYMALNA